MAISIAREKIHLGIQLNGEKIDMVRFVDDVADIAENEKEMQRMLRCMEETLLNVLNMKINTKKTKTLVRSKNNNIRAKYIYKITEKYIKEMSSLAWEL